MSGHGVTSQDIPWLVYGVRRLRAETHGAAQWDEAGIVAEVRQLIGQNLALTIERVFAHAADPEARTPGAIRRPFKPAPVTQTPSVVPKRHEACGTCGRHQTACLCPDGPTSLDRRPPAANPTNEYAEARAALKETRHA